MKTKNTKKNKVNMIAYASNKEASKAGVSARPVLVYSLDKRENDTLSSKDAIARVFVNIESSEVRFRNKRLAIVARGDSSVAFISTEKRRRPEGYRAILQHEGDAKTVKGMKQGFLTGILYLAPHKLSGVINTCVMASLGCIMACLFTAGRAAFSPNIRKARIAKTVFMVENWQAFMASLAYDIRSLEIIAHERNLTPCVRINGTSDMPKIAVAMARMFSGIQFYDYTKLPKAWLRTLPNYHLTFSHSEVNHTDCMEALAHGINVAVVFDLKPGKAFPETWNGYRVVSGDETDLRFTDEQGVVVGLYAKGQAKKDCSGFVVKPELFTIAPMKAAA
jgi:hypothetical protein